MREFLEEPKNRRRLIFGTVLVLLAIVIMLLLRSCGGGESQNEDPNPSESIGNIEPNPSENTGIHDPIGSETDQPPAAEESNNLGNNQGGDDPDSTDEPGTTDKPAEPSETQKPTGKPGSTEQTTNPPGENTGNPSDNPSEKPSEKPSTTPTETPTAEVYTMTLNGPPTIHIKIGGTYTEFGVTIIDSKGNRHTDLEQKVEITGSVDTSKLGQYTLTYKLNNLSKTRTVYVDEAYVMTLIGDKTMHIKAGGTYTEQGVTIKDSTGKRNTEMEAKVVVTGTVDTKKVGFYILTYKLDDMNVSRTVYVDESYTMRLVGSDTVRLKVGGTYTESGVIVYDSSGKRQESLEKDVTISGTVNTKKAGTYTLTYSFDGRTITRTVIVETVPSDNDNTGGNGNPSTKPGTNPGTKPGDITNLEPGDKVTDPKDTIDVTDGKTGDGDTTDITILDPGDKVTDPKDTIDVTDGKTGDGDTTDITILDPGDKVTDPKDTIDITDGKTGDGDTTNITILDPGDKVTDPKDTIDVTKPDGEHVSQPSDTSQSDG